MSSTSNNKDTDNNNTDTNNSNINPRKGYLFVLFASFIFSIAALINKISASAPYNIPGFQIMFVRSVIQFTPNYLYLVFISNKNNNTAFGYYPICTIVLLRGLSGAVAMGLSYYSLAFLSLSDSIAILFTSPVYTSIFARIFLKEKLTIYSLMASVTAVIGTFLIATKGSFSIFYSNGDGDHLKGILIIFSAAILVSIAYTTNRAARVLYPHDTIRPTVVQLNLSVACFGVWFSPLGIYLLESGFVTSIDNSNSDNNYNMYLWLLPVINGIISTAGQAFLNQGMLLLPASISSTMRTLDVITSIILQAIFIPNLYVPNAMSYVGSCLIVIGLVALGYGTWMKEKREKEKKLSDEMSNNIKIDN